MPNPLRKSGSSSSKNSSSSSNSEEEKKVTLGNGLQLLTAAQYRKCLRLTQGIVKHKSDKKKKDKVIPGPRVDKDFNGVIVKKEIADILTVLQSAKVGAGTKSSMIGSNGQPRLAVPANVVCLEELEEGEIREESTVPLDVGKMKAKVCGREEKTVTVPRGKEEDVGKGKAKVCDRGGVSKVCAKEVPPRRRDAVSTPVKGRDAVLTPVKGKDGNVCVVCNGGNSVLLGCNFGCKKKYHLKCHDPPLKDVPPGGWHCSSCVKMNTGSGALFSPEAVKSNLGSVKVELADPEVVDKMAVKGRDDTVCVVCRLGGSITLLGCKGISCKKKYHLKCHNPPLKLLPPGDWYCSSCVKKNIGSGFGCSPGSLKSKLDAVKVELADSDVVDKTKSKTFSKDTSSDCVQKLKEKPAHVVDTAKNKTYNKDASSDCVQKLKEKPAHVVVSKFVEYWVPVKLSDVQLEQYCHILLSNSALLWSRSKPVEALRDVFSSTRKCCDHPYFLEPSLQKILTDGLSEDEFLNVGIKASGKLQALDQILTETKKQGLRVVIIFQSSVGSTGISLGDVLDDVVRQRCGVDSYERVDCGVIVPKSQFSRNRLAAMNRFNDNEKGRMVFLLDRRACHTTVKLSSVDIVLLYDSELKVRNDFKVLQKITIESQQEQLKVFRLYSLGTFEEKALYQDVAIVDSQNLNCYSIHQLLRWGASYLFKELTELHGSSSSSRSTFSYDHLLKELFGPLPKDAASPSTINSSIDVKVNQDYLGQYISTYERDTSLPGLQPFNKDPPHVFWTKLLNNRETPKWRYLPAASASQRIRKRVHLDYPLEEETSTDNDEATKKRRKVLTGAIDVGAHKPVVDKRKAGDANKEGTSVSPTRDCSQFLRNLAVPTSSRYRKAIVVSSVPASCACKSDVGAVKPVVEEKGEVGGVNTEGASETPAGGDSSLFTDAARFRKAGVTTSVPDKVSVQQEFDGEIRESHQSCQTSLPPTSEPPCSVPAVVGQVELVNNSAAAQLQSCITSETRCPEIPVEDSSASVTASQPSCPTQPPATQEHAELPSPVIIVPLQSTLPLPAPTDKSAGGSGISDSGSSGGIPNPINHKESDQVGLVVNSAPEPSTRLQNGIQSGRGDTSHPVGLPAQPATPELHSELPSNNGSLQDRMCKTPVVRDRCKGGSLIRVSDFPSLGVVPDRIGHPLQSAPPTSSRTPQTQPQDDPFLREQIRICQSLRVVPDRIGHPLQSAPSTSSQAPQTRPQDDNFLREQIRICQSLRVVPDRIGHPSPSAPSTSSQTPQTQPQDDPFLREQIRLRQELLQAEKSRQELHKQLASDHDREMQELAEKYNKIHHDNDTQCTYARNGLHTKYNKLLLHSMLAGAFREKML